MAPTALGWVRTLPRCGLLLLLLLTYGAGRGRRRSTVALVRAVLLGLALGLELELALRGPRAAVVVGPAGREGGSTRDT